MRRNFMRAVSSCAVLMLATTAAGKAPETLAFPPAATAAVTFASIQPILEENCVECHGPKKQENGLRVDVKQSALLGGDSGPLFVPGKATESELLRRLLLADAKHRMPYKADPLSDQQIGQIMAWIDQGADWPDDGKSTKTHSDHWAFQKPVDPEVPQLADSKTVYNAIDAFVQAPLARQGIQPSPLADRHTLIRRLHLDLIGLPPSPQAVQDFVNDSSSEAYSALVDSLLNSAHFGEKWAQYWLDIARYADSDGYEKDLPRPDAYHWRDWLIQAINRDLPFDQFTVQQIAGDLLPGATDEIRLATGFSRNTLTNREGGVDREEFRVKSVVDRTNTTMTAWMGLTVGCAQCHSHKYDPLTQRNFYGLFAVFNNSDEKDLTAEVNDPTRQATFVTQLKAHEATLQAQEEKLAAAKAGIAERLAKWELQFQTNEKHWRKAQMIAATGDDGAKLELAADGSLIGPASATRVTVRIKAEMKNVTGLRIRALGGAGDRAVTMTHAAVQAKPLDASHGAGDLLIEGAVSRDSQSPATVAEVRRSKSDTGWTVGATQSDLVLLLAQTPGGTEVVGNELKNGTQDSSPAVLNIYSDSPVPQAGVATGAKVMTMAAKGAKVTYYHLRPLAKGKLSVVATESFTGASKTGIQAVTFKTPWQLEPGDLFAHHGNGGPLFTTAAKGLKDVIYHPVSKAPKSGETITLGKLKRFGVRHYSMQLMYAPEVDAKTLIPAAWGAKGAELTVTLRGKDGHVLPRLLFELTDHATPQGKLGELPADIAAIIVLPAAQRSAAQTKQLLAHYTRIDVPSSKAQKALDALTKKAPKKPTAKYHVMAASKPRATHVHRRGNFMDKGAKVDLHTPSFLHPLKVRGDQPDRLDFARWLVDEDNPLMPRVTTNQVWAELFGRGLVKTIEDFGTQGETASHPELLDWLAHEWRRLGWSRKALIRKMVHSYTYRQSSVSRDNLHAADPENLSLARQNRFRLRGELVRDQYLAVAGLLNRKVGGASFRPPLPQSIKAVQFVNKWTDGKGDVLYRRAMYIHLQRNLMLPMLMTFDHPDSIISCSRRERSNTPLQALTLLNGGMFVEAAQALAVAVSNAKDIDKGIDGLYLRTAARPPSDAERQRVRATFETLRAHYAAEPAAAKQCLGAKTFAVPNADAAAWVAVSRAVLNLDEMITRE